MAILHGQKRPVDKLKGHTPYKKVGHCSTLDNHSSGYRAGMRAKIHTLIGKLLIRKYQPQIQI